MMSVGGGAGAAGHLPSACAPRLLLFTSSACLSSPTKTIVLRSFLSRIDSPLRSSRPSFPAPAPSISSSPSPTPPSVGDKQLPQNLGRATDIQTQLTPLHSFVSSTVEGLLEQECHLV